MLVYALQKCIKEFSQFSVNQCLIAGILIIFHRNFTTMHTFALIMQNSNLLLKTFELTKRSLHFKSILT